MTISNSEPRDVVAALIAGLGVASHGLDTRCEAAFRALGGRAVPPLRAAAAEAPPRRRDRIQRLLSNIGESQDFNPDFGNFCRAALLVAAAVQNDQDNPGLIPALKLLGPAAVDTLVRDAVVNRKKPAVCLRILKVVEQLGAPSGVDAQFEVALLVASKNAAVKELAIKLFCCLRPSLRALEAGV